MFADACIKCIKQAAGWTKMRAVPAIYTMREFPLAGGLISYGASEIGGSRQAGVYVGRRETG
jgi:hypothetical protein